MPQYDGLDELDSSLFSSQTLDREWGYQNQHPISDQFPWFGSEPNPEGYNAAQTNEEDYLLGIDFNLLVNQPFHHFNSWNFGGGFKSSSSLTESELPVSNSNIPGPSNGCFAEISTDPNSPAHVQQPPANLATIEPSPLGPTPNRPCQSSGVNQPASQNEKSQRPNGFIESTSQQATDQQIWLPSAGASLGLGPQFPSVSVVPQIAVHVPPRIYPIIVPRVTALQPIPTKHCNPSATNTRTQKLITSPSTLANTQITEVESISTSPASFDACITVFETTPGALTKVKRRRKLDPTGHKSFKVTRKIGSCLECRFRKRPVRFFLFISHQFSCKSNVLQCNPGNPCEYCVKVYGSPKIAQLICHRESPFVSYDVTDCKFVFGKRR
jgi:hypothetical protein